MFLAVDHVNVAVAHRAGRQRRRVRADARLGQAIAAQKLHGAQPRQPLLALRLASHEHRSSRPRDCGSICRRRPSGSRSPAPRRSRSRSGATARSRRRLRQCRRRPCRAPPLCAFRRRENAALRPRPPRSARILRRQNCAPCRARRSGPRRARIAVTRVARDRASISRRRRSRVFVRSTVCCALATDRAPPCRPPWQ